MHAILFRMKRTFQSSLTVSRKALAEVSLTPARFDMIFAIGNVLSKSRGLQQHILRRQLGVTSPTVSRMIRSLLELRFITRERASDRRTFVLRLTSEGRWRLRRIVKRFISTKRIDNIVEHCIGGDFSTRGGRFAAMLAFEETLFTAAPRFGDRSHCPYLWHPDD